MTRCAWVNPANELYVRYHDEQWGVPVHDDTLLFEMLILEGAQAGLSWETILKKRENYRAAYRGFDPETVAAFTAKDVERLLQDAGIVRNRRKIAASIQNAKVFLEIRAECGSFDAYVWNFVQGKQLDHAFGSLADVPPKDAISDALSKDLKKRGMNFVGSTIMYSFMQAIGMVNDHTTDCFRHAEVRKIRA